MKKILIIIPSLKKWWWAENVATNIWNKLYENWYEINYFTFYNDKNNIKVNWNIYWLSENISKNFIINIIKLFKRSYYISKYVKINNIDVCISHLDEANFSNIISKIIFNNKSKIIIEIHNSIEKSLSKIYLLIYKLIINFADKIVSLTKEDLLNYKKYFKIDEKKLINIYNPVDINIINKYKCNNINDYVFNKNDFVLINIWRLNNQKNQRLLINAFNKFNSIISNSKLIILWEWELKEELENEIIKLNNKNIFLLWRKNNPYKYIKNSDYLIMTSNYEWLPVVQIESLACETPIISSDCKTWPKEIINIKNIDYKRENKIIVWDCWILFPTWNEEKLLESIFIAYNNKNNIKDSFLKNSKNKVNEFNINNIIKLWEKIINE